MRHLLLPLAVCVGLPVLADPIDLVLSDRFEMDGQSVPFRVDVRLSAVSDDRISVTLLGDLGSLQALLPKVLGDTLDPTCGQRLVYQLDDIAAEGDMIRARGAVQLTLYACNGYEDLKYRFQLLQNTTAVEALIGGAIENGCVAGILEQLSITPSGIIGGIMNVTGLSKSISTGLQEEINSALNDQQNCLDMPKALRIMNTRISSGGFREIGDGGLGFYIFGSVDVTAPKVLALLDHLADEGLLDR